MEKDHIVNNGHSVVNIAIRRPGLRLVINLVVGAAVQRGGTGGGGTTQWSESQGRVQTNTATLSLGFGTHNQPQEVSSRDAHRPQEGSGGAGTFCRDSIPLSSECRDL